MKTLFAIKRETRRTLRPVYWSAFLVCLVAFVLAGPSPNIGGWVPITLYNALQLVVLPHSPILQALFILPPLYIFILGPLEVGRARYFLRGIDGNWQFRNLFSPFLSRDYIRIAFVMGVRAFLIGIAPIIGLIIIFAVTNLGAGLFFGISFMIIGLVVYYRQRLTPYILSENPKLKFAETWDENAWLSEYRRFKGLFVIDFSFYTWYIAGALFFGVGLFFFFPYHQATMAMRYRELYRLAHIPKSATKEDNTDNSKGPHMENSEKPCTDNSEEPYTDNSDKPPQAQRQNPVKTLLCLAIVITILLGAFPVSTASAHDEAEHIVTTEQELRDAVEQNLSPIRIDTTIALTEGTIIIDEEQDIVLRGTGSLVMATEPRHGVNLRHFSILGGRLTLQDELSLTLDPRIESGGGVRVDGFFRHGEFIMEGGRIEYNRTSDFGGGVQVDRGTFTMHDGVIRGNSANSGGGVDVGMGAEAHFVMHGGQITENYARRDGGGIYLFTLTTFNMTGGEISYNHAEGFGGAIGTIVPFGYEHISISPDARFYANTAEGQVRDRFGLTGEARPHGSFGLYAGFEEYPQIRWNGDNSRPGTHLINNYDIGFVGVRRPATWQVDLVLVVIVLLGKGIALLYFLRQDKKAKSLEEDKEDAVCDATE